MQFSWDIFGGSIPGQFEPAIVKAQPRWSLEELTPIEA